MASSHSHIMAHIVMLCHKLHGAMAVLKEKFLSCILYTSTVHSIVVVYTWPRKQVKEISVVTIPKHCMWYYETVYNLIILSAIVLSPSPFSVSLPCYTNACSHTHTHTQTHTGTHKLASAEILFGICRLFNLCQHICKYVLPLLMYHPFILLECITFLPLHSSREI